MKIININKMNAGGIVYTPFVPQIAQPAETKSTPSASDKEEKSMNKMISEEMIKLLKQNGLQSDVSEFLERSSVILTKSQNLVDSLFGGSSSSYDLTDIKNLQLLANNVKYNKEMFDLATAKIQKENSWSEAAMDSRGSLYVYSENGLTNITPNEYYKNKDQYTVLTNSELLSLRQSKQELAYNQNIINDLNNSTGINTVASYIKDFINDFGTNSSSTQHEVKMDPDVKKGMTFLAQGNTQNMIAEANSESAVTTGTYKQKISDQGFSAHGSKEDINKSLNVATKYIWNTLNNNMKNIIIGKVAAEGLNPNNENDVLGLLKQSIIQHTDHSISTEFDEQATTAKSGKTGESEKKDGEVKVTHGEAVAMGVGVDYEKVNISAPDSKVKLTAHVQRYGAPIDKDGNMVTKGNMTHVLNNADFGRYVDKNSVFLGNTKITDLNTLIWDGTSSANRIILPYDVNHYKNTGEFKPDLNIQNNFEQFQNFLNNGGKNKSQLEIMAKAKELKLPIEQSKNENGETTYILSSDVCKIFISLNGYTSSRYNDAVETSPWVTHYSDTKRDDALDDEFVLYANYRNGVETAANKSDTSYDGLNRFWPDGMYGGNIFVAVPDEKLSMIAGNNQLVPKEYYRDIQNKMQSQKTQNTIKKNFSSYGK